MAPAAVVDGVMVTWAIAGVDPEGHEADGERAPDKVTRRTTVVRFMVTPQMEVARTPNQRVEPLSRV